MTVILKIRKIKNVKFISLFIKINIAPHSLVKIYIFKIIDHLKLDCSNHFKNFKNCL